MGCIIANYRLVVLSAALGLAASGVPLALAQTSAPAIPAKASTSPTPALAPPSWPSMLLMPWRLLGIDSAASALARPALESSIEQLARSMFKSPRSMAEAMPKSPSATINAQKILERIYVGEPASANVAGVPLAVEPHWGSLMDRQILLLTVADARKGQLLGSTHISIPTSEWLRMSKQNALAPYLESRLPTLAKDALQIALTHPASKQNPNKSEALHLALNAGRELSRSDEGAAFVSTMLLEEQFASRFQVARTLGADRLATVRAHLGLANEQLRPTRSVLMLWSNPPEASPNRQLPVTLGLSWRVSESVRAGAMADQGSASVKAQADAQGRISLPPPSQLVALLEREQRGLLLSDAPQVVKVDRAWAYVDRGRAFGLKIGDRLVAPVDNQRVVKGHIVKYFGPEAGLKSPRTGATIADGAIIYIRKNQKLARQGLVFDYDAKTFPAPWPPPNNATAR